MRHGKLLRYVLLTFACSGCICQPQEKSGDVSTGVVTTDSPTDPAAKDSQPKPAESLSRDAIEAKLKTCLGKNAKEITQLFGVKDAKWTWIDEPPGILRGALYYSEDVRLKLYVAEGEPLFRKFSEDDKWDHEAFLACRIGGIQFRSGDVRLDIGPAVPFQFRGR